ncbi:hypothetical protein TEGL_10960 [Terrisporobacter glycolicus ATCC 14880 = DSM 1288]|uniref:Uncharacterized protein n=1 Tax=Terrisporobacter glycolicus ATCC 14880 = DSM 1288 TaxID=1121315 RepID=A0ABZ2ESL0_9FIRM
MRILKCIVKIFFRRVIYKYKNVSYMEISIGLEEDNNI